MLIIPGSFDTMTYNLIIYPVYNTILDLDKNLDKNSNYKKFQSIVLKRNTRQSLVRKDKGRRRKGWCTL